MTEAELVERIEAAATVDDEKERRALAVEIVRDIEKADLPKRTRDALKTRNYNKVFGLKVGP